LNSSVEAAVSAQSPRPLAARELLIPVANHSSHLVDIAGRDYVGVGSGQDLGCRAVFVRQHEKPRIESKVLEDLRWHGEVAVLREAQQHCGAGEELQRSFARPEWSSLDETNEAFASSDFFQR
jgi:hypothetical protein